MRKHEDVVFMCNEPNCQLAFISIGKVYMQLIKALYDDSYNRKVQFRKRSNSIIVNRKSVRSFKQVDNFDNYLTT